MIKISILAPDLEIYRNTLYIWHKKGKIDFVEVNKIDYIDIKTYNKFINTK